jgi:hypothetical protein
MASARTLIAHRSSSTGVGGHGYTCVAMWELYTEDMLAQAQAWHPAKPSGSHEIHSHTIRQANCRRPLLSGAYQAISFIHSTPDRAGDSVPHTRAAGTEAPPSRCTQNAPFLTPCGTGSYAKIECTDYFVVDTILWRYGKMTSVSAAAVCDRRRDDV